MEPAEISRFCWSFCIARTKRGGAITKPRRQPVIAYFFEKPLSTKALSVNSRIVRARPP
jgi:hypothetical protein